MGMVPCNGRRAQELSDLDDALLLQVFSSLLPLPDLFNVSAVCRRFRDLALDRRTWLLVTHAAPPGAPDLASPRRAARPAQPPPARAASAASLSSAAVDDSPHWYRSRFGSLAEAVAASRPGDTILLEAGQAPHAIAAPIIVPHPVHILGGGSSAGECVLAGAKGIEALLDFRASGRLANLTLQATSSACVAHTRGRLTVQSCTLECDACGLQHLVAPLLTRAVSHPPPPCTHASGRRLPQLPAMTAAAAAAPVGQMHCGAQECSATEALPPAAKRLRAWRSAAEAAAGVGVLSVVETRIKSCGIAVDLRGSGRLSNVRALYCSGHALVWLEVDSANCNTPAAAAAAVPAAQSAAEASSSMPAPAPPLPRMPASQPSWLWRAAAVGFDAAVFQQRASRLVAGAAGKQQPGQQVTAGSMDRKAEEWCLQHHSALAPDAVSVPPLRPE